MVDIQKEIQQKMLNESKKPKHIFNNDSLTFKQLKELFTNAFDTNIVSISRKVPVSSVYVTNKDGEFYIASVNSPSKLLRVDSLKKVAKIDESASKSANATIGSVVESLSNIDPVLLNRYFANGKNLLKCSLICPPDGCGDYYGDKCFIQFDGIDCYDGDDKKVGQDQETSAELMKALKNDQNLSNEFSQVSAEQLNALKRCRSEKNILKNILDALAKLVDGIGWGCSIKYYIQDRYARHIINKALEHGLDVSKNGSFVDELASRLSGTSVARPTKSDLVTFAKREGIDCKSQEYKDFLNDIESAAEQTSQEIIAPIENIIYYGISKAANNIIGLMALDPNPKAQKLLKQIATTLFDVCDDIGMCGFNFDTMDDLKKALCKLCTYKEIAPQEIRIMNCGKPFSVKGCPDKLDKLYEIIA